MCGIFFQQLESNISVNNIGITPEATVLIPVRNEATKVRWPRRKNVCVCVLYGLKKAVDIGHALGFGKSSDLILIQGSHLPDDHWRSVLYLDSVRRLVLWDKQTPVLVKIRAVRIVPDSLPCLKKGQSPLSMARSAWANHALGRVETTTFSGAVHDSIASTKWRIALSKSLELVSRASSTESRKK